jgi:hypothetical protein
MASISDISAGKIYIGPEFPAAIDASIGSITDELNPIAGTLACTGPAYFGLPTTLGAARATVTIAPPIPTGPQLPFSLEVSGITNLLGMTNQWGVHNVFGISNHIGLKNTVGLHNHIGFYDRIGAALAIGGETKVQPYDFNAAPFLQSAAVLKTHFGNMHVSGTLSAGNKLFDIEHPTQEGKRLRHGSLEGPENGVYVRGKLEGGLNVIELPEYWKGLVDPESITVQLTAFGHSQELYVGEIQWGSKVIVKNNAGSGIRCYYFVQAERKDIGKLEVEVDAPAPEPTPTPKKTVDKPKSP